MKTMKQWMLLAFSAVVCAAMVACADSGASSSSAAASSAPASSAPASSAVSESVSAPSSSSQAASESGEAAYQLYSKAIVESRDQETNDALPVIGAGAGQSAVYTSLPAGTENDDAAAAQMADMILQTLALTPDQLQEYAFSISLINVKAYGVGVFMPAEGQTDAVKAALEDFVANQQKSFEHYLADQYEIAKQAKVEVLPTGEIVLVMCENSDEVFTSITEAVAAI